MGKIAQKIRFVFNCCLLLSGAAAFAQTEEQLARMKIEALNHPYVKHSKPNEKIIWVMNLDGSEVHREELQAGSKTEVNATYVYTDLNSVSGSETYVKTAPFYPKRNQSEEACKRDTLPVFNIQEIKNLVKNATLLIKPETKSPFIEIVSPTIQKYVQALKKQKHCPYNIFYNKDELMHLAQACFKKGDWIQAAQALTSQGGAKKSCAQNPPYFYSYNSSVFSKIGYEETSYNFNNPDHSIGNFIGITRHNKDPKSPGVFQNSTNSYRKNGSKADTVFCQIDNGLFIKVNFYFGEDLTGRKKPPPPHINHESEGANITAAGFLY